MSDVTRVGDPTAAGRVEFLVEPFDGPSAVELIAAVQQEYVIRYGGPDETEVSPAEFAPPLGLFLVGYLVRDGRRIPVASGGWRSHGTDAEVKRMYVAPAARRRGVARMLLAELERTAAEAGHTRVILETGHRQPEAIALYTSSGYSPIQKFGYYREHEGSLCYGKPLA